MARAASVSARRTTVKTVLFCLVALAPVISACGRDDCGVAKSSCEKEKTANSSCHYEVGIDTAGNPWCDCFCDARKSRGEAVDAGDVGVSGPAVEEETDEP
jgi:hypothetical protein